MKFLPTFIIIAIIAVLANSADPNWSFIPSLRAGKRVNIKVKSSQ